MIVLMPVVNYKSKYVYKKFTYIIVRNPISSGFLHRVLLVCSDAPWRFNKSGVVGVRIQNSNACRKGIKIYKLAYM